MPAGRLWEEHMRRIKVTCLNVFISVIILSCLFAVLCLMLPSITFAGTTGGNNDLGVAAEIKLTPEINTAGFSGDANISISIIVPPGRANIKPDLKLTYNSSSGDGWIGLGWNIEIGSIQRQTKNGINYNNNDYFIGSGNESGDLVLKSGSEYGMKIEESFSKFFKDSDGWRVLAKDGTIYYYGKTADSRQNCPGSSSTFKWHLNRVQDSNGNYMDISYTNDNNEIYIDTISYTGNVNDSTSAVNLVKFYYTSRSNAMTYGIGGISLVKVSRLLRAIEVKANSAPVRIYGFEYHGESDTALPILWKVTEYDNTATISTNIFSGTTISGSALPPIQTTHYENDTTLSGSYSNEDYVLTKNKYIIGDFNGDGLTDYIWIDFSDINIPGNMYYVVNLRNGSGSFDSSSQVINGHSYTMNSWLFATGDFNGDGKTDMLFAKSGTTYDFQVYLSNGSYFQSTPTTTNGNIPTTIVTYSGMKFVTGDFNGDGCIDIMYINLGTGARAVHLNNGSGNFGSGIPISQTGYYSGHTFKMGDFNGDGKTDYMFASVTGNPTDVFLSDGSGGFTKVTTNGVNYVSSRTGIQTGDFNGDGKTDYMWIEYASNTYHIFFSLGDGKFSGPVDICPSAVNYIYWTPYTSDFNGDGKTDIMWVRDNNEPVLYLSKGDGSFSSAIISADVFPGSPWVFATGDFNGDAREDMIFLNTSLATYPSNQRTRYVALTKPTDPKSLLKSITNMTGGITSLEYKPSSTFINTLLPYNKPLVTKITKNDGLGNTSVQQYEYAQGKHDFVLREFLGFGYVKTTQPDSSIIVTNYHQDEYLKGLVKDTALYNPGGAVLMNTVNTWIAQILSGAWKFVKLDSTKTTYNNNGSYFTRNQYTYNTTHGGVTSVVTTGTGAEQITYDYNYANYGTWLWKKTLEKVTGATSGVVRKTEYDYFTTTGNLKKETKWEVLDNTKNQITWMTYYGNGNLRTVTDPREYVTTTEYETTTKTFLSKVIKPTTANGIPHITQYLDYDYRVGKPKTVIDENNQATTYAYDSFGRLYQTNHPDGGQNLVFYTDSAVPRYEQNRIKESATSYIDKYQYYDGFNRPIQTVTFGTNGKRIVTRTYYDLMGRIWQVNGPYFSETGTTAYPYAKNEYDYRGRILSMKKPDDEYITTTTTYSYSEKASGFFTAITDPDGKIKEEKKDHLGRIIQVTEDAASGGFNLKTYYTYNAAGDMLTATDAAANVTTITYNTLGQKKDMTDPDRGKWYYTYDLNGNLATQQDAKGQFQTFTYDELNRIMTKNASYTGTTCPNGGTYNGSNCQQSVDSGYTCPLSGSKFESNATCSTNCSIGSCIMNGLAGTFYCTKYGGYDGYHCYTGCSTNGYCNNMTCPSVLPILPGADTCPSGASITSAGMIYAESSYLTGIDSSYICSGDWYNIYTYTSSSYWTCTLNGGQYPAAGSCATSCYQSAACTGPVSSCPPGWTLSGTTCTQSPVIQSTAEPTVTYTYDSTGIAYGTGRLAGVTNTKVTNTVLGYDEMGRKLGERRTFVPEGLNYDTWYGYDLAGKMTDITYPDNYHVMYDYYPGTGLFKTVTGSDGIQYSAYSLYEPTGKIGQVNHANGAATRYTYGDKSTRLYGIVTTTPGPDLQDIGYRYTAAGDLAQINDYLNSVDFTYTYDNLHRLRGETNTGVYPANTYDYDTIGNITKKTMGSSSYVYSYVYPRKHAVSSIAVNGGTPVVFGYDANGNTTGGPDFTDTAATGTRTVTYNMDNMPATLTYTKGGNTTVSEFTYDGAGLRAKKKVGGSATYYVNANYEVKDGVATKYVTAADLKIAQIKGNAVSYYHKDHLNSSSVMTNASGVKVEGTEYAPYGTVRTFAGTPVTSYRYTGKELDTDTGLYYYGARYYDPMIGRFITADSVVSDFYDPQDLNRYAYARNNPMKYVDPNGHAFETAWDVINIGIGVASLAYNIKTGNTSGAIVDGLGILGDSVAAAVPFVPGGFGAGIRASRAADKVADVADVAHAVTAAKAESKVVVEGAETAAKSNGRSGKQAKLREIANDDKFGSADRGWIKQEINSIERGEQKIIRNPPGKDLAHERGREAAKGYGYDHSNLQDRDLHRLQHKYDDFGRKNKERVPERALETVPE